MLVAASVDSVVLDEALSSDDVTRSTATDVSSSSLVVTVVISSDTSLCDVVDTTLIVVLLDCSLLLPDICDTVDTV